MKKTLILLLVLIYNLAVCQNIQKIWQHDLTVEKRLETADKCIYQNQFKGEQIQDSLVRLCYQLSDKNNKNEDLALYYYIKSSFKGVRSNIKAISQLDTALSYAKDQILMAKIYMRTGRFYRLINKHSEAFNYLEKANQIARNSSNHYVFAEMDGFGSLLTFIHHRVHLKIHKMLI